MKMLVGGYPPSIYRQNVLSDLNTINSFFSSISNCMIVIRRRCIAGDVVVWRPHTDSSNLQLNNPGPGPDWSPVWRPSFTNIKSPITSPSLARLPAGLRRRLTRSSRGEILMKRSVLSQNSLVEVL